MSITSILVIGGGNMGAGLAMRWQEDFPDARIVVAETDEARRAKLRAEGLDAPDELDFPDAGFAMVVLAIKPQAFPELMPHLSQLIGEATLVSIMAGVPLAALLETGAPHVARVMPNTPAIIGEGISAIFAPDMPDQQLADVQTLFAANGRTVMVDDEEQMHAITAISGSGPAYVFAFMEALEHSAVAMGIDPEIAQQLVQQTVVGAALLADVTQLGAAHLRQQVTSPGGTTEAALNVLNEKGLQALMVEATQAAQNRSKALS